MASNSKNARHNQETILFILMGLILLGLVVSGYFLFVKKILPELSTAGSNVPTVAQNVASSNAPSANVFIPDDEAQILKLYFAQKTMDNFRAESRKVRRKKMLTAQARQIVEEILRGPESPDLYSAIPQSTSLRGLFFDSGTFIVDLSKEFATSKKIGAVEQTLAVYSLVNSLTELDPRAKVRILINGIEQNGEDGHIDLSHPMTRLKELIVQ